jgi:hypothetical protein
MRTATETTKRATRLALACLLLGITACGAAPELEQRAQALKTLPALSASICLRGDRLPCTSTDLASSDRRTVLVLATGYTYFQRAAFEQDLQDLVRKVDQDVTLADLFTRSHRDRLLYVGVWKSAQSLSNGASIYGAQIDSTPSGDPRLALDNGEVIAAVEALDQSGAPGHDPTAVVVLYNTTMTGLSWTSTTPTALGQPYGIAKVTPTTSGMRAAHELSHAALGLADEGVLPGLSGLGIRTLDVVPLQLDASWPAALRGLSYLHASYGFRVSEVFADNGHDNLSTTQHPSRVTTSGHAGIVHPYQGGLFGLGVWREDAQSVMGTGWTTVSSNYRRQVKQLFDEPTTAGRVNDRLRTVGPAGGYVTGSTAYLVLLDADKHHHLHPTTAYEVEIGWYEKSGPLGCGMWGLPDCVTVWKTATKAVSPARRGVILDLSQQSPAVVSLVRDVVCAFQPDLELGGARFCSLTAGEIAASNLTKIGLTAPYQEVAVQLPSSFTTYYWRARADNGTYTSGWTGWQKFSRSY